MPTVKANLAWALSVFVVIITWIIVFTIVAFATKRKLFSNLSIIGPVGFWLHARCMKLTSPAVREEFGKVLRSAAVEDAHQKSIAAQNGIGNTF